MSSGRQRAPQCPFCGADLQRPSEVVLKDAERGQGGTCSCGARYFVDSTGKNVGIIMAQALDWVADELGKKFTELETGADYEDAILSYDWRTHRSAGVSAGYRDGYGRLYVVKVKKGPS